MGAAQTRNFWKNWVNFFVFWEDNLALAKFQCPTDTCLLYTSKLDIMLNGDVVDALSFIIHADKAYGRARKMHNLLDVYKRQDVNDVTAIQLYIAQNQSFTDKQKEAADVNKDGKISVLDLSLIHI